MQGERKWVKKYFLSLNTKLRAGEWDIINIKMKGKQHSFVNIQHPSTNNSVGIQYFLTKATSQIQFFLHLVARRGFARKFLFDEISDISK